MNKYITELIGTFFLVLTIGCTVIAGAAGVIPPLAIGSALMVVIFAGGHISGGHYNPAVTLGVWIRGRCDTKDVVPYIVSQIIGAVLAAVIVKYLKAGAAVTAMNLALGPALLAEFLFTFADLLLEFGDPLLEKVARRLAGAGFLLQIRGGKRINDCVYDSGGQRWIAGRIADLD